MKNNQLAWALTISLGFFIVDVHSQEAIPASGMESTGSGGTVSSTIGQVIYSTNQTANGSVSQGVQQAYTIVNVNGIKDESGLTIELTAYPNPTQGLLNIKVGHFTNQKLNYQLLESTGKLLNSNAFPQSGSQIDMSVHAIGIYFLIVYDGDTEIKTFKIIKN